MSCSVQLKTRSTVKSKKVNNVIHRTTSETIRLGEPEVVINNTSRQVMTALAISPPPLKKSSCSFQVTGVSLTQRTDFAGEDSADDLDESHTDDISRVTDNETPSFSEDTCSRDADDNYIGSCSALCSVTVIPSSSQYGLAIVPSETSAVPTSDTTLSKASASTSAMSDITETQTSPTKEEPVTTASTVPGTGTTNKPITTTASTPVTPSKSKQPPTSRFPGTRFEVVKVESIVPFRRGRWYCMDYLDDSKYAPKNALTYKSPDSPEITCTKPQPQYTMTATTTDPIQGSTDFGTNFRNSSGNQVQPMGGVVQGPVHNPQMNPYYSNIVRQSQSYANPIAVPTQQLPAQVDVMQTHNFIRQTSVPEGQNFVTQNQYFQNLPMGITTLPRIQQSDNIVPQIYSPQQPIGLQQNMTLPCVQNQGQIIPGGYSMQNQPVLYAQTPNQSAYISQAPVYMSPPQIVGSMQNYNLVQPGQNQALNYTDQVVPVGSVMQQSYSPQAPSHSISTPATQQYVVTGTTQATVGDSSPGFAGKRSDSSESSSSGKTSHSSTRKSSLEALIEDPAVVTLQVQAIVTPSSGPSVPPSLSIVGKGIIASSIISATSSVPVSSDSAKSDSNHGEAANNTSAIIDTKIEQAMDLVKSHLMYTVREEVEVLKVRIAELLDRINQLEMENSFLKANASQEVLNALNSRAPQEQAQGNIPTTGAEGGATSK